MSVRSQAGFTLVELMVASIAAALLALTVGVMLVNGYLGWVRGLALADMERDAAVAVHAIDLSVRGATNANAAGGTTLTVYLPTNGGTRVFSASGSSPRGNLEYNGVALVSNRLESFGATVTGRVVSVSMSLAGIDRNNGDTGVRMGVTNLCIRMRNAP